MSDGPADPNGFAQPMPEETPSLGEGATDSVFVTIIIVNYNAGAKLAKCLDHLGKQVFKGFEIIVVDNASEDDSIELAQSVGVAFQLISNRENVGFAAANNQAAKLAQSAWLAFLNPDAYALPDWLAAFKRGVEKYPWADAFGSTQIDANDNQRLDGAGDVCSAFGFCYRGEYGHAASEAPDDGECFAACAAAAFYRRERFDQLGGFDERFFCYGEDVDLGYRLQHAGGRTVQLREAIVNHEGSAITGRQSAFSIYHGHRNRIWLYYKNTPLLLYLVTLPLRLLADLLFLVEAMKASQLPAYLRALRDGYGELIRFNEDRRHLAKALSSKQIAVLLMWAPWQVFKRRGKLWRASARN